MEKLELYHFHKKGDHDKDWQINKTIIVPNDFKSTTFKRFQNFTTAVPVEDGSTINYYDLVHSFLLSNVYDKEALVQILSWGYQVAYNANEFKRENALENYRLNNVSNLPSRLHSVYLTDEKGIETWKNKFGNSKLELYRVEAEGYIFKTNEQLIPVEELSYQDIYDASYNYWHPNFKKVPDDTNEYLMQGKIKILEKIDKI